MFEIAEADVTRFDDHCRHCSGRRITSAKQAKASDTKAKCDENNALAGGVSFLAF
jgi:hypothetical protein